MGCVDISWDMIKLSPTAKILGIDRSFRRAMEVLKFVAATIIITSYVMIITTSTPTNSIYVSPPPMAKPNCPHQCGNVTIPFPFGIGPACSADDKWFEIVCITNSKPFLKSIPQVEVLHISIENGTLQVAPSPIWFFDCPDHKEDSPSIKMFNLSGSPFSFSETHNWLTVVGCNYFAYIDVGQHGENVRAAGCTAFCPKNWSRANDSSSSIEGKLNNNTGYCETIIPSYLNSYHISFETIRKDNTSVKRCTYAFVVDQGWLGSRLRSDLQGILKAGYVPVILNWDVLHNNDNLKLNHSFTRQCRQVDATSSIDGLRYQCFCHSGYGGNPYLRDGCKDINECGGNNGLCSEGSTCVNTPGSYNCKFNTVHKIHLFLIGVSSGLGALLFIFGAWGFSRLMKRRKDIKRKQKFFKKNGGLLLQQIHSREANVERKTELFNSMELEKATDHYNANRILGQGGQGTVYKGMLEDGKIVAVKKSKLDNQGKVTEFINEVVILSQINHKNVVKLLGCCLETEVPLLLYEFIPNGTLYHYIHDQNEEFQLTWEIRIRIATEVAEALSYLHFAASIPIYHRDIKSTNILLDEKYRAKIADFGTSRSISEDQTHLTTHISGTFGYMDPEFFRTSQYTEKSDVYSFGVVIVELLSGQKPVSLTSSRQGSYRSLATYFIECMEENHLFDIVEPRIIKEEYNETIKAAANLAYRCLNLMGRNRPTMKEVTTELERLRESLKMLSSIHDHDQNFEKATYSRSEVANQPWEFDSITSIGTGPFRTTTSGIAFSSFNSTSIQ